MFPAQPTIGGLVLLLSGSAPARWLAGELGSILQVLKHENARLRERMQLLSSGGVIGCTSNCVKRAVTQRRVSTALGQWWGRVAQ